MKTRNIILNAAMLLLSISITSCREGYTVPFYIGCLEDAEPYSYRNSEGEMTGYEVDMIQAAADYYGIRVSFVPTTYNDILNQLQKKHHKIDGAVAMIPWTVEQMENFTFVNPSLITTSYCLAVKSGSTSVTTMEDLKGKKIAVMDESLPEGYLLSHADEWGCTVIPYSTFEEETAAVINGTADVMMDDRLMIEYHIKRKNAGLSVVEQGVENIAYGFVTGKNQDKTLRRDIQSGLGGIFDDGTARKIYDKYFD